jgi:hypothetical protein
VQQVQLDLQVLLALTAQPDQQAHKVFRDLKVSLEMAVFRIS